MNNYTESKTPIPTFEDEVTRILGCDDRVNRVEFDGEHAWILHLGRCSPDEAETARLEIVDNLTETLGEDACGGLEFWSKAICEQAGTRIELDVFDEGTGEDDEDESPVEIEPDEADYLDRFLTLTAKHHHAVSVLLGNIIGAAAKRLAREKGQSRGTPESRELEKCLRRTGTPQATWRAYIDEPTNIIRVQALEMEATCVMAAAHALDLDVARTVRVLDAYGFDVDEGDLPTSSFMRWYRDWKAFMDEAAQ